MADARLLRLATHDATPGTVDSNGYAAFDVDLNNVFTQLHTCVGFSIESAGFYNLQSNVSKGYNQVLMALTSYNAGLPFLVVVPNGQYDSTTFPAALHTAILTATALAVNITVAIDPQGHLLLTVVAPPGQLTVYSEEYQPPGYVGPSSDALVQTMGFSTAGSALSYTSDLLGVLLAPFHIDLGGQRVVFVDSSFLIHDKNSVDGEGLTTTFFTSLPIVVPYEFFNNVYPNQYQTTSTFWGREHEIRNINLSLRTLRGDLYDVQGTEWYVTLRLFLADE